MRRRDLANRLMSAATDIERRKLLTAHKKLSDISLAREIKDICYSSWMSEPIVARNSAAALKALVRVNPETEIKAVSMWVAGIAEITKARFEQAIKTLDEAAQQFEWTGKQNDAAQTMVAKLIALAQVGRYREADRAGRKALKVFEKTRDQLAAGKIELNLSNIAARRERHREAEKFARSALSRFKKIGEKNWQTMAENDLANTYSEINDFRRAEKYFGMAVAGARSAKMRVTEAEIEASMGNLALFRAHYGDALRLLELSRQKYDELKIPHQTAIAELEIAEIYIELNLLSEASSMLDPIVGRLKELGLRADEARARSMRARLMLRLGKPREARKEVTRATKLYTREQNVVGLARTALLAAEIEARSNNYLKVIIAASRAAELLKSSGNKRLQITARLLCADAERRRGRATQAKRSINKTIDEALKHGHLNLAAAGLNSLGELSLSTGERTTARAAFARAVQLVERQRAPIASDELRMSFLAGQLDPYNALFAIAVEDGRYEEAFTILEASRARSLADVIESGETTVRVGKLARDLERFRDELNWFYSRLARATTSDEFTALEKEIASRELEIDKITRRLNSTSRRTGNRSAFDPGKLRSQLQTDKALIEYVSMDGKLAAFVITKQKLIFIDDLGTEAEARKLLEGLRFQFGTLRFGAAAFKNFAAQLKSNTDHYLNELYKLIFARIEPLLGARKAIVVPSGVLNYIPFNALFDGADHLIEKREVSIVPSAAVWGTLASRRAKSQGEALLFGYSDESIPLAEQEARKLKDIYHGKASLYVGNKATFGAFVDNASRANIIHLACHGKFRTDNPMFSSLHLADGWITVRDLSRQRLKARLVTLSACETGISEIRAGDELLGLTRGFLSAGAQNLIVSLWPVNDGSTLDLMTDLYRNLQLGLAPAASLRAAQLEFIRSGVHPYYWSPFVSIGA